jgi:small nuclear ribonucleoprotein (snRNP)-like protein
MPRVFVGASQEARQCLKERAAVLTQITVELKNDLSITGTLHSVDQYLNIKLNNIRVVNQQKYPHMLSVRNCFIRGSVVRYVQVSW